MRPYDPRWRALLVPSGADDFFADGRPDDETALCAELSRVAYIGFDRSDAERDRAREILDRAGFDSVEFFSAGGTECYAARDRGAQLTAVAFRGTTGARDVLTDLTAWRTRWTAGGLVHAGFAGALMKVWLPLSDALSNHDGRLIFTGHSLGAALATLAATLVPAAALYTFGSPRVGDLRFVQCLSQVGCVRVTDCADLVCNVPPPWLGYVHAGRQMYLDRDGAAHFDPLPAMKRKDRAAGCRDYLRRWAWRPGNVWTRRLADHAPINYVTALSCFMSGRTG